MLLAQSVMIALLTMTVVGCADAPPSPRSSFIFITLGVLEVDGDSFSPQLQQFGDDADWHGQVLLPSSHPIASLGSLLTGLDPWRHQLIEGQAAGLRPLPTLARQLGEAGWETAAWVPPFLGRTVLVHGFSSVDGPERAGEAVTWLERKDAPLFLWVHFHHRSRLDSFLEGLRSSVHWDRTFVAITATSGNSEATAALERESLLVPLHIKLPAASEPFPVCNGDGPIAAHRIATTMLEAAEHPSLHARVPSLFRCSDRPVLASRYFAGGENRFLLIDGDLQLRWTVRYAGEESEPEQWREEFLAELPFSGGPVLPPTVRLEHWREGELEELNDPEALHRLAQSLERRWSRHQYREQPPAIEIVAQP